MQSILYVDDEPGLLEIGKYFLEAAGEFRIDTRTSAADALAALRENQYDAIVSDYQMPEMDGIEFLKAVRASQNPIPFILFTGRGREEIVIQALNEGADFYLQKGGDPGAQFAELAHKIRQAVRRREAECSVLDHERRERDIIDFLPDATFAIDTNGVIIAWNRAIEELTGIPAEQMIGKGDHEYTLPFYQERRPILIDLLLSPSDSIGELYSHIVRSETTLAAETTFPRLKGERRTLWTKATLLYNQKGSVVGAIESIRDITERKTAEEELESSRDLLEERVQERTAELNAANLRLQQEIENVKKIDAELKESERRFHTLIDKAPDAILLFDADQDRYIEANEKAEQFFGCSRSRLLEAGPQQFYLPDQPDGKPFCETVQEHRRQVLDGAEISFERRIRDSRGTERDLEVRLTRMPSPARRLIRSSFIDITDRKRMEGEIRESKERKKAEEELRAAHEQLTASEEELRAQYEELAASGQRIRESEKRFRDMFEINTAAMFLLDPGNGRIIDANRAACRFYGYSHDELTGMAITQINVQPPEKTLDQMQQSLGSSGGFYQFRHRKKDGEIREVEVFSGPVVAGGKTFLHSIVQDVTERKQAEAALKESEEKYRAIFETTGTATTLLESDGTIVLANSEFVRLSGFSKEEIENKKKWTDFVVREDLDRMLEQHRMRRTDPDKALRHYEFRFLSRSGDIHDIFLSVDIIPGTTRSVSSLLDVTEGKRIENNLKKSENLYRSVIENIQDTYYRTDLTGNLVMASPSGTALLGYDSVEEFLNTPVAETFYFDPAERARFLAELEKTGSVTNFDTRLKKRDGTIINVSTSSHYYRDEAGAIAGVEGLIRDVTERRRAERALMESEEKYRSVVENIRDAIYIHRKDRLLFVNRQASELSGYSRDELMRITLWEIIHPDDRKRLMDGADRRIRGESVTTSFTARLITKGGLVRICEFVVDLISYQGEPAILGIARDLTDQKRTEEALRAANKKLNLLSGMTRHDITNKVTIQLGMLALEKRKLKDTPERAAFIGKLESAALAIRDQIAFTRTYQDLGTQEPRWQDLHEVLGKTAIPPPLSVSDTCAGIEIFADIMLGRVFENLIDNAIRHGGNVTEISMTAGEAGGTLVVRFEDNGTGIPAHEKEKIFERGYGKNTGLGLFLAREVLAPDRDHDRRDRRTRERCPV